MRRNPIFVYSLLVLVWVAVIAWQAIEHQRVREATTRAQLNHARDIATSLGVVIRSQRRFGAVSRDRLVDALESLAQSRELEGLALLSPSGEIVASGGQQVPGPATKLEAGKWLRDGNSLLVAALVELGPDRRPPDGRTGSGRDGHEWTLEDAEKASSAVVWNPTQRPPPDTDGEDGEPTEEEQREQRRSRWERMRESHPFWQSPESYKDMYERMGLHMMVLMLNDDDGRILVRKDALARAGLVGVALIAVFGFGLAYRGISRSTQLQVRLARAQAMNSYLRELNLAAAGLAHETRNPLNKVRGHAQMVANDAATSAPAKERLTTVLDEVDRITARLNEFIDYSKPREPHLAPVSPATLARDVARTLETDLDDKQVTLQVDGDGVEVLADATLFRQVLFNLILNAVQAVGKGGCIEVHLERLQAHAELYVRDNGGGVPEEAREDIFRPYVTLSEQGSGLGLAVVRQIVLAHGWTIVCEPAGDGRTSFRIGGIHVVNQGAA